MSHLAPFTPPPNTLPIWTDGLSLWTAIPGPDGALIPLRYPLTSTGLAQALGLVRTKAYDGTGAASRRAAESHQPITRPATVSPDQFSTILTMLQAAPKVARSR